MQEKEDNSDQVDCLLKSRRTRKEESSLLTGGGQALITGRMKRGDATRCRCLSSNGSVIHAYLSQDGVKLGPIMMMIIAIDTLECSPA